MIDTVLRVIGAALERVIPDKVKLAEVSQAVTLAVIGAHGELVKSAAAVVAAEARSRFWITAAWRPITMLIFAAVVANNYIVAPYLDAMFGVKVTLELPPDLWDLLKIGLGGYVVGRSAEKIAETWSPRRAP